MNSSRRCFPFFVSQKVLSMLVKLSWIIPAKCQLLRCPAVNTISQRDIAVNEDSAELMDEKSDAAGEISSNNEIKKDEADTYDTDEIVIESNEFDITA